MEQSAIACWSVRESEESVRDTRRYVGAKLHRVSIALLSEHHPRRWGGEGGNNYPTCFMFLQLG